MTLGLLVFSVLQPLEDAVRWLLDRFHYNLGLQWSWSIVATTVVVRVLLVPLTVKQIHSMQVMQRHAPALKELQKKYKGDRQKLQEETMKFYKEHNFNPAASCLPLVAQIPVFFSLYLVLRHFSDHVPKGSDLSWLHVVPDISAKADSHWSGFLLLAIYAISQVLSTWFMSATMDKTQRAIMLVLPLVFISVVAHFPAGLVLYWVTTNLWTVGQGLITRRVIPKTPMPLPAGPKRSSRSAPKSPPEPPTDKDEGNGASQQAPKPKPQPSAQARPRRVKKKRGGARR
jgi:YidC/Oxa1 family membrane protein insertase